MSDGSTFQVGEDAPRHYQEQVSAFMVPISEAMVSAVVAEGDRVLDVACGTGIATRLAASAVGAGGSVVGSDINVGMVDFASAYSAEEWPDIEWSQASALDLPHESASFDRTICQQGVQFFPDPAGGLEELGRVTRPGGSVAISVWSELSNTPYFEALGEALVEYGVIEPTDMNWSTTRPTITEWFEEGGLSKPTVEVVEYEVDLPPLRTYVASHMRALPWAATYFGLDEDTRASAVGDLSARMSAYKTSTGIRVPFSSYLAHAEVLTSQT